MTKIVDKIYEANKRVSFGLKVSGQGEPLIFLHGMGGLRWNPFLEKLSEHYMVIAPYLPGTGTSTGLENINDLWDLILTYYDLFDKLDLESVNVIGHSFGGMLAIELAATDQSRVKSLVAITPIGLFKEENPIPDLFAMLPGEMVDLMVADKNSPLAQMLKTVPEDIDERLEFTIERVKNFRSAAKFIWPIPDKGLKSRIHRVKAPTLLIWGRDDGIVPVDYAYDFNELIENSRLEIIDNASHLVFLEQTDEVVSLVLNFLQT